MTETERSTDRETVTETQRDRQTETVTETERDRQTDRDSDRNREAERAAGLTSCQTTQGHLTEDDYRKTHVCADAICMYYSIQQDIRFGQYADVRTGHTNYTRPALGHSLCRQTPDTLLQHTAQQANRV